MEVTRLNTPEYIKNSYPSKLSAATGGGASVSAGVVASVTGSVVSVPASEPFVVSAGVSPLHAARTTVDISISMHSINAVTRFMFFLRL